MMSRQLLVTIESDMFTTSYLVLPQHGHNTLGFWDKLCFTLTASSVLRWNTPL